MLLFKVLFKIVKYHLLSTLAAGFSSIYKFVIGDVQELLKTPLVPGTLGAFSDDCHAGSAAKAVSSRVESRFAGRVNLKHPVIAALDINPATCTFSTGVFVTAQLEIWRKEDIMGQVMTLLQSNNDK